MHLIKCFLPGFHSTLFYPCSMPQSQSPSNQSYGPGPEQPLSLPAQYQGPPSAGCMQAGDHPVAAALPQGAELQAVMGADGQLCAGQTRLQHSCVLHLPSHAEFRQKYSVKKTLGRGGCATVKCCIRRDSTRQVFTVKYCPKVKRWEDEVMVMQMLNHKNIIKFEEAFDGHDNDLCIVMELAHGGNLLDVVTRSVHYSGARPCHCSAPHA